MLFSNSFIFHSIEDILQFLKTLAICTESGNITIPKESNLDCHFSFSFFDHAEFCSSGDWGQVGVLNEGNLLTHV